MALILGIGLIPRLALVAAPPTLSEDLYRYLWDGRLVAHGVNPYAQAPSDTALVRERDGLYARLNHPDVRTIYPPAAQILFAATARVEATPRAWKVMLFALEGFLVVSLLFLLRRRRHAPERLLLYYWNPLVVVECYGSGHLDLALAAFLLLALALHEGGHKWHAGHALAAATLTKFVPLLLLPALIRRGAWSAIGTAAALAVLLYLPFSGAGASVWEGLRIYARHWEFNGAIYPLLRPAFRNGDMPRLILATGLGAASIIAAFRARTLTGAALTVITAFLLASPTVYPWYLIPAVALLPLHAEAGLLVFSGLVALTYLPLPEFRSTGVWTLPSWIPWVEYGGLAAVWILAGAARRIRPSTEAKRPGPLNFDARRVRSRGGRRTEIR